MVTERRNSVITEPVLAPSANGPRPCPSVWPLREGACWALGQRGHWSPGRVEGGCRLLSGATGCRGSRRTVSGGPHAVQAAYAAELIVSELVTNAIRYGAPPLQLRLIKNRTLTCEVHDDSATSPTCATPAQSMKEDAACPSSLNSPNNGASATPPKARRSGANRPSPTPAYPHNVPDEAASPPPVYRPHGAQRTRRSREPLPTAVDQSLLD